MSWHASSILLLLALLLAAPQRCLAFDELPLKAAVIYNLLLFVEWPGESELPPNTPLLVCADRSAPLWPHLASLQDRPLRQRRFELREAASVEAQRPCHAWVLEDAGQRPLSVRAPAAVPVLVIGDGQRADEAGVSIGLRLANRRLLFDVDMRLVKTQGLMPSSKMLRLARTVRE